MSSNELRRSKKWIDTVDKETSESVMKDVTQLLNKYDLSMIDLEKSKKNTMN